jgi:hypothetical protein
MQGKCTRGGSSAYSGNDSRGDRGLANPLNLRRFGESLDVKSTGQGVGYYSDGPIGKCRRSLPWYAGWSTILNSRP